MQKLRIGVASPVKRLSHYSYALLKIHASTHKLSGPDAKTLSSLGTKDDMKFVLHYLLSQKQAPRSGMHQKLATTSSTSALCEAPLSGMHQKLTKKKKKKKKKWNLGRFVELEVGHGFMGFMDLTLFVLFLVEIQGSLLGGSKD
ncbi:hypothetical protein MRB53_019716 [Persea americana]|uniref:Uncharacterized protein n=1 Tax=Persea americana TaxID=3435 RepID=A0ACC2KYV8_PERAE|nr:hypothetical protein MRB53_019716 [Persea americana]